MPGPGEDLVALERVAVDVAVAAALFLRDERPEQVEVASTKTTPLDVVTAMDTGSEALLRTLLAQRRPGDGVLGEEGGVSAPSAATAGTGLTWVVDPLDGTVNYLYGLPAYAVSVAVVRGEPTVPGAWTPLAAAVADPEVGQVFHGREGGGAWLSRLDHADADHPPRRLSVSACRQLDQALVGTGFSYDRAARHVQGTVARGVLTQVRDLRRAGSAALDLCSVAAGRLDGCYERGLHPWDLAAGLLLVREAGGEVTGISPTLPASRDMVIAAGPGLHPALSSLVSELHEHADGERGAVPRDHA